MYQGAILISPEAQSMRREFRFSNTVFDNEVAVSGGCVLAVSTSWAWYLRPAYLPIQTEPLALVSIEEV